MKCINDSIFLDHMITRCLHLHKKMSCVCPCKTHNNAMDCSEWLSACCYVVFYGVLDAPTFITKRCVVGSWPFLFCSRYVRNNNNRCSHVVICAPDLINNIPYIIPLDYTRNLSLLSPNGHSHLPLQLFSLSILYFNSFPHL